MDRATSLGAPFDRIYHVHYAELSWMTHSGVVSPLNMTTDWVTAFVGIAYSIAADSYMEMLEILVNEFKLYVTNEHLKRKIRCNHELGFTRTPEEGESVMRKYGLWGISSRLDRGQPRKEPILLRRHLPRTVGAQQ